MNCVNQSLLEKQIQHKIHKSTGNDKNGSPWSAAELDEEAGNGGLTLEAEGISPRSGAHYGVLHKFVSGGLWVWVERLKNLCQKAEESMLKESQAEAKHCTRSQETSNLKAKTATPSKNHHSILPHFPFSAYRLPTLGGSFTPTPFLYPLLLHRLMIFTK